MKILTPLDRVHLASIPLVPDTRTHFGGPYDLDNLLQESEQFGDEEIDWRDIQIADAHGNLLGTAEIWIMGKPYYMNESIWAGYESAITQKLRYVYRQDAAMEIEGAVTLELSYTLHGVRKGFAVDCEATIREVVVKDASRGRGIARTLLAEVLRDVPGVRVFPHFSASGAKLFGFDDKGRRENYTDATKASKCALA